jgi:hypothetical protein
MTAKVVRGRRVLLRVVPIRLAGARLSVSDFEPGGFQAFEPVLASGDAIEIHPAAGRGLDIRFEGEEAVVHVPLSIDARVEAETRMSPEANLFRRSDGEVAFVPEREAVLGLYYLTLARPGRKGEGTCFSSVEELCLARTLGKIDVHAKVRLRQPWHRFVSDETGMLARSGGRVETTVGRAIVNDRLPIELPYYDRVLTPSVLQAIVSDCVPIIGLASTVALVAELTTLGLAELTRLGLSLASEDIKVPATKEKILADAEREVEKMNRLYQRSIIGPTERQFKILDTWHDAADSASRDLNIQLSRESEKTLGDLGPLSLIAASRAYSGHLRLRSLSALPGPASYPTSQSPWWPVPRNPWWPFRFAYHEIPIRSSFIEGLSQVEYYLQSLASSERALTTELWRSQADEQARTMARAAQNLMITTHDCGTSRGVVKGRVDSRLPEGRSLVDAIRGRVSLVDVVHPDTDEVIVRRNTIITPDAARTLGALGIETLEVRSPATCEARRGICRLCYGIDLSTGDLVAEGTAVGLHAALTIGRFYIPDRVAPTSQYGRRPFDEVWPSDSRERTFDAAELAQQFALDERDRAVLAEAEGLAEFRGATRRDLTIVVETEARTLHEHPVPIHRVLGVSNGAWVKAGDVVVCGTVSPRDILRVLGHDVGLNFMLYRLGNIVHDHSQRINDRHFEVILSLMLGTCVVAHAGDSDIPVDAVVERSRLVATNRDLAESVVVDDPGDSCFNPGDVLPRDWLDDENARIDRNGGQRASLRSAAPAVALPRLRTVREAADAPSVGFLRNASQRSVARVLADAALTAEVDLLLGMPEKVILGERIPASRGLR